VLAKVALDDKDSDVSRTAIGRLEDRAVLAQLVQSGNEVAVIRQLLTDPVVVSCLGKTRLEYKRELIYGPFYASSSASRPHVLGSYDLGLPDGADRGCGEHISIDVCGEKLPNKLIPFEWVTTFPARTSSTDLFFPCPFSSRGVVGKMLELLPPAALNEIAANYKDFGVRQAAAAKLAAARVNGQPSTVNR